jgi:hypothetical protein
MARAWIRRPPAAKQPLHGPFPGLQPPSATRKARLMACGRRALVIVVFRRHQAADSASRSHKTAPLRKSTILPAKNHTAVWKEHP